jgi:uncharacterized YkwD family protein
MKKWNIKKAMTAVTFGLALTALSTSAFAASNYTVQYNDTLYKIAQKNGVSLSKLIAANPQIQNINWIYPGESIHLPTSTTSQPAGNYTQQTTTGSFATQVAALVNQERAKAGLAPLRLDSSLSNVAMVKAKDMSNNNYFSHYSPTYGSPFDMMNRYGISFGYAGENIAMGQQSPTQVMTDWMNSQGHRENILSPNYDSIGVAFYNGYWVQEFTGKQ